MAGQRSKPIIPIKLIEISFLSKSVLSFLLSVLETDPIPEGQQMNTSAEPVPVSGHQDQELHRARHDLLTFRASDQNYALPVLSVQEIRRYEAPLKLPGASNALLGVLNLRGQVIPVIDLRTVLGIGEARFSELTVTVVLQWEGRAFGLVVDSVSDVVEVARSKVQPMPTLNDRPEAQWLGGVVELDNRTVTLLQLGSLVEGALGESIASVH